MFNHHLGMDWVIKSSPHVARCPPHLPVSFGFDTACKTYATLVGGGSDSQSLLGKWSIHPGRLTWNLRIHPWKRKIIFQTIIFRFYVNLPRCIGQFRFSGVSGKFQRFQSQEMWPSMPWVHRSTTIWSAWWVGQPPTLLWKLYGAQQLPAFEILGHWVIGMWDIDSYGICMDVHLWMFQTRW